MNCRNVNKCKIFPFIPMEPCCQAEGRGFEHDLLDINSREGLQDDQDDGMCPLLWVGKLRWH